MVDNKGWRKKKGGKSNDPLLLKTTFEDAAAALPTEVSAEPSDRRRHVWRKTIATSRAMNSLTPVPTTPTADEVEGMKSEQSEAFTPRQDTKPKLTRYTSLFTTHKEESTSSAFSEPWSVDPPPDHGNSWAFVDPVAIMETIYAHMCKNYMVPIPLQYTAGLFQIFDDYRKLRSHKELLEGREKEMLQHTGNVTARWLKSEELYQSEIRRLELLIARGTSGMAGLIQARQNTVVDRQRHHRKPVSSDRLSHRYQHMSSEEIEEEIKIKTQQVLLHRPTSPSGEMTALSRQLTNAGTLHFPIGTPPNVKQDSVLSQKLKSELKLTDLRYADAARPISSAHIAGQLEDTPQQITSDDRNRKYHALEFNAFTALKELGALVARRRGLDVAGFVNGLMALLTSADTTEPITELLAGDDPNQNAKVQENRQGFADDRTPRPPLRISRSQSYQGLDQKHRRHFSFEPGDDQSQELETGHRTLDWLSRPHSTDFELSSSADWHMHTFDDTLRTSDDDSSLHLTSTSANFPKPSMIPSPVQLAGRLRRGNSTSSLQSAFNQNYRNDRHNSRTSIQTAFREASSTHVSTSSKSRNSSNFNLRAAESPQRLKDRLQRTASRQSNAGLAAARAAESRSTKLPKSSTQPSTAASAPRKRHGTGPQCTENNNPITCRNAGQKDAK